MSLSNNTNNEKIHKFVMSLAHHITFNVDNFKMSFFIICIKSRGEEKKKNSERCFYIAFVKYLNCTLWSVHRVSIKQREYRFQVILKAYHEFLMVKWYDCMFWV